MRCRGSTISRRVGERVGMSESGEAVLRVEDLTIRYNSVTAVKEATFEVGAGEIVAIIGPNGAGKSSLLSPITAIASRAQGHIEICGRSIDGVPRSDIVRLDAALVPEGRQIFTSLSVIEKPQARRYDPPRRRDRVRSGGGLCRVSRSRRAAPSNGGTAFRWRATDARDRERAHVTAEATHAGRAIARPRADGARSRLRQVDGDSLPRRRDSHRRAECGARLCGRRPRAHHESWPFQPKRPARRDQEPSRFRRRLFWRGDERRELS